MLREKISSMFSEKRERFRSEIATSSWFSCEKKKTWLKVKIIRDEIITSPHLHPFCSLFPSSFASASAYSFHLPSLHRIVYEKITLISSFILLIQYHLSYERIYSPCQRSFTLCLFVFCHLKRKPNKAKVFFFFYF